MQDERIEPDEAESLQQLRQRYGITDSLHKEALKKIGKTQEDFAIALKNGLHEGFGVGSRQVKTYHEYRAGNYCRGLICTLPSPFFPISLRLDRAHRFLLSATSPSSVV